MSGDDDHGPARPDKGPAAGAGDTPSPRPRKAKPPPGIITAGGVDMARAHASGIELRDGPVPEPTVDQPRVMLAVEADLRKVPTHPRLAGARGRAEAGARSAAVAAGSTQVPPSSKVEGAAGVAGSDHTLPSWLRLAFALVLLVLLVGLVQRLRAPVADGAVGRERAVPIEPVPVVAERPVAARPSLGVELPARALPSAVREPTVAAAAPSSTASAEAARRVARPPPPPAPKSAFTPPFQLPGEEN
jgi:hypothetical protein